MFDLNISYTDSASDSNEEVVINFPDDSGSRTEDFALSDSVHAEVPSDRNETSTLSFEILGRRDSNENETIGIEAKTSNVVSLDSYRSCEILNSSRNPHWLNLNLSIAGADAVELHEKDNKRQVIKKSRRGPRSRSSQYRGVTFYRRTGRWESHIWDCGKQVYLGGFDTAIAAARAYDRAALKFRGLDADINFDIHDYDDDFKQMRDLSKEEFVQILRRRRAVISRGCTSYRGATQTLHKCVRSEARFDQFLKVSHGESFGEVMLHGSNNLDLNLMISTPCPMEEAIDHDHRTLRVPQRRNLGTFAHNGVSLQEEVHLPHHPKHLPSLQNIEGSYGRAAEIALPIYPNWAWRVHGHHSIATLPLFASATSS